MEKIMYGVLLLLIVFGLAFCTNHLEEQQITDQVKEHGGTLIDLEARFVHTPYGFLEQGKGVTIYHFTYTYKGKTYEGWVNEGSLLNKRWIWGHQQ